MHQRNIKKTLTPQIKPTDLVRFHAALAKWYKIHGRHELPWRNTADPYHIWLSEVMLQQTQVATVRDRFYQPFLTKFPTIEALATAPSEAVMKAWEGLGYYSRARNLHKAARTLSAPSLRGAQSLGAVAKTQGRRSNPEPQEYSPKTRRAGLPRSARNDGAKRVVFPTNFEGLVALPGIGRNTASAILAFAYHQPVAILEANVKRVVARIFALEHPSDAELWAAAEALLDTANPFDYNQAMMDLGSMVCTPKTPACGECPANRLCKGKAAPERYPAPKIKKQVPTREVMIEVHEDAHGRLHLEKRDAKLLGGLYGFPQSTIHPSPFPTQHLGTVAHTYSHFKLIGHVVHIRVASKPNTPDWFSREQIASLPLSKLDHKVLALVENCHSQKKKKQKSSSRFATD